MKIIYWVLAGVFVLFAAVQYNDPDPLRWMLLYGATATVFVGAALGWPVTRRLAGSVAILSLIFLLRLVPDFWHWIQEGMPSIVETMKAEKPLVELVREFLGALLCLLGCGWMLWRMRVMRH